PCSGAGGRRADEAAAHAALPPLSRPESPCACRGARCRGTEDSICRGCSCRRCGRRPWPCSGIYYLMEVSRCTGGRRDRAPRRGWPASRRGARRAGRLPSAPPSRRSPVLHAVGDVLLQQNAQVGVQTEQRRRRAVHDVLVADRVRLGGIGHLRDAHEVAVQPAAAVVLDRLEGLGDHFLAAFLHQRISLRSVDLIRPRLLCRMSSSFHFSPSYCHTMTTFSSPFLAARATV